MNISDKIYKKKVREEIQRLYNFIVSDTQTSFKVISIFFKDSKELIIIDNESGIDSTFTCNIYGDFCWGNRKPLLNEIKNENRNILSRQLYKFAKENEKYL